MGIKSPLFSTQCCGSKLQIAQTMLAATSTAATFLATHTHTHSHAYDTLTPMNASHIFFLQNSLALKYNTSIVKATTKQQYLQKQHQQQQQQLLAIPALHSNDSNNIIMHTHIHADNLRCATLFWQSVVGWRVSRCKCRNM